VAQFQKQNEENYTQNLEKSGNEASAVINQLRNTKIQLEKAHKIMSNKVTHLIDSISQKGKNKIKAE
jgi:hypothetical protein